MSKHMRGKVAFLALVAMLGCRDSTGMLASGAAFEVNAREYVQGQALTAQVTNDTGYSLGINLCLTALQHRVGSGWRTVTEAFGVPPDAACVDMLMLVDPGMRVPYRVTVPLDLAPGTYRLATGGELRGQRVTMTTSPFTVRAP